MSDRRLFSLSDQVMVVEKRMNGVGKNRVISQTNPKLFRPIKVTGFMAMSNRETKAQI
ncbi:MAG: hypothetical protein SH818_04465 [Saprospiraceae bacterium]|nr:hypothetical protein [Saprospiraceae bacterium]